MTQQFPQDPDEVPLIVGRAREQQVLRVRLAEAVAGRGSLVLVGGETGIGKTTLVDDLGREATGRGVLVRTGRCYDLTSTPPYGPWADAGLLGDVESADDSQGSSGRAANSQAAMFEEVHGTVESLAVEQPLLLVLEDLHWADPTSLDLLPFIARQLATLPLLVVVTYRNDELTRTHPFYRLLPTLVRQPQVSRLDLHRLTTDAIQELVAARYNLTDEDAARLVTYLDDRAEGNPFFACELLRALEDERRLRLADSGWILADLTGFQPPLLLRQVIDSRVERIGEDARNLLITAAVIGQEVPFDLWHAVSGATEEQLGVAIEQAISTYLLEEVPGSDRFRFRHTLVRESLYERLVIPQRRILHRQIAELLSEAAAPDADTIAHHFQQANDPRAIEWLVRAGTMAQRTAWLTAAGRFEAALSLADTHGAGATDRGWLLIRLAQLYRFADPRASNQYLDEVVGLAEEVDDPVLAALITFYRGEMRFLGGDTRQGLAEQQAGVDALDALSTADRTRYVELVTSGFWPDQMTPHAALVGRFANFGFCVKSCELGEPIVDGDTGSGTAGDGHSLVVQRGSHVYSGLALSYVIRGQPERARQAFVRARAGFRASHNQHMIGSVAQIELISVLYSYYTDDLAERERLIAEVEEIWEQVGGVEQVGWPPRVKNLPYLILEGYWTDARRIGLALRTKQHRSVPQQTTVLSQLGQLAREQGDSSLAWTAIREAMPEGPDTEPGTVRFLEALALQRLAVRLALDANDPATARSWLNAHDHWLAWSDAVLGRADGQLLWARYYHATDEAAPALCRARDALSLAGDPRQPLTLLRAHRFLGRLLAERGQHGEAEQHINEALGLATACAAPYERALSLLAKVELLPTGDRQEARSILAEAREICTSLEAKPALERITTLEDRLAAPDHSTIPPGILSARELDVLQLVAEGLTDGQVAEQLYVSPRTVSHHLRSIYNKLNVPSRAAAVREAIERELV